MGHLSAEHSSQAYASLSSILNTNRYKVIAWRVIFDKEHRLCDLHEYERTGKEETRKQIVKLIRAYGGCLGAKSRRRTR